ncbi:MAG TPA: murein biosynthesis integral membrane protein MurJ [bacterium]|nr:murein biosynthesis integral membrane protein MurJ [bacterium]
MGFKKIWHGSIDSVGWAAIVIGLSSFISRFLGVFRDRILAGQFGAGDELDAYYAAFRVPDLIYNLLVLGALSAGFVPIFISLLNEEKDEQKKDAWRFANLVANSLLIILVVLGVAGVIFAPQLLHLLTPGFSPEKLAQTVQLSRLMFLSPIFLGLSGVAGGILQSFKSFFVYSLSPIFYNLGIIAGALFLAPRFGLIGLAWGVVIGAALHLLVQIPTLKHFGYNWQPIVDWRDSQLRKIGRIMVPRTLGLAVGQLNLLSMTVIASGLASGSLAVFNLANNLQSFPVGIFGLSLAVAAFPTMSALVNQPDKLRDSLTKTIRQALFLLIISTILIISLRAQIVRVILGSGCFDWRDTILTMRTLSYFGISIFAQALIAILTRVFYAHKDSMTPFWIGLLSTVINIILAWFWKDYLGVAGLALAFSVSNLINLGLLWLILNLRTKVLATAKIFEGVWKMLVAAGIAWPIIFEIKKLIAPIVDMNKFWGVAGQLIGSATVGVVVYLVIGLILNCSEAQQIVSLIKRRWPRNKSLTVVDSEQARGL